MTPLERTYAEAEPGGVDLTVRPARVAATVYRAPTEAPVHTSFGTMTDRPAVLVEVEDADGARGWGEIWCNFPTCGAEHRARLVETVAAPMLIGETFASPVRAFAEIETRCRVLALQTGEDGPLAQMLAGVDIALWDLAARRTGLPLYRLLGGEQGAMAAYASGLNPRGAPEAIARAREGGHTAFKVKTGFGAADLATLADAAAALGEGDLLMTDANQAWDFDGATRMTEALGDLGPAWLEEPIPVDRPKAEWQLLAQSSPIPLAGGENLRGLAAFQAAADSGALAVIQPDTCKWGGITGTLAAARAIRGRGRRYCPHYLGGGIGLSASAHLLAAVGGDGLLEIDVNANPLRDLLAPELARVAGDRVELDEVPGLGSEPDLDALADCRVS